MMYLVFVLAQLVSHPVDARVSAIKQEIQGEIESIEHMDLAVAAADFRSQLQELRTLGIVVPPTMVAGLDALVERERSCRASVKCMADRAFREDVVKVMCSHERTIALAKADIERERSNPSGVVDLEVLHDDGDTIQREQDALDALRPKYVAVRHHAWDPKVECR